MCEGLLNQQTVDCCIKWMGCKSFKRKLVGFLRFKEAHESHLLSLHRCYGSIWREDLTPVPAPNCSRNVAVNGAYGLTLDCYQGKSGPATQLQKLYPKMQVEG
jgi:hypothetical protein